MPGFVAAGISTQMVMLSSASTQVAAVATDSGSSAALEFLWAVMPSIISAVILGVVAYTSKKIIKFIRVFRGEHKVLMKSQRNQLKASIRSAYEKAQALGWISPMELETVNSEYDSYKALGGNHYIHTLIKRLNESTPIKGEEIPIEEDE